MSSYRQQNLGGEAALLDFNLMDDEEQSREGVVHDDIESLTDAPAVPRAVIVEYLFRRGAALLAAAYVGALLWGFFSTRYFGPAADASELSGALRGNPQTGIALCLIFAAAFLWLWKGLTGRILALASYLFVAWQFYYWFKLTGQVKENTGRDVLSGVGRIGNTLYGAGWLEVFTVLAVLASALLSAYLLQQSVVAAFATRRPRSTPRPLIDRVSG